MNNQLFLCNHYMVYDIPNGTYSNGHCLYCGKKDKALNVMPQELKAKHNKISIQHLKTNNNGFYLQGGNAYYKRIRDMEAVFFVDKE